MRGPHFVLPPVMTPHDVLCILMITTTLPLLASPLAHTIFCIPTARRDVSYLDQVVESYSQQHVFNMNGVALAVIDIDNSTLGKYTPLQRDRTIAACDTTQSEPPGMPTCRVRQQGLDVTSALMQCAAYSSAWVVLAEDDCVACEGGLDEVIYTLSLLHMQAIAMAKFSKFLRATAFPVDIVSDYAQSVRNPLRLNTRPYDVTKIEEWAPGRREYIHTRNLFHHIGYVSTEPARNDAAYRAMYAELRGDVCFDRLV